MEVPESMPIGNISSSDETVGVSVINYPTPVLRNREEVLENCHQIAEWVKSTKIGYPGLDLIIFPEGSTQGFNLTEWEKLSTTVPGPETEIFSEACRENNVWGVFSITGERNPNGNPYNSFLLIDSNGAIRLNYHKINPWVPKERSTPGHETRVAEGPKGLKIGANICYDSNMPELVRDTVMKGAELIVRISAYPYPSNERQLSIAGVRAFENLAYFATSSLTGRSEDYYYFGHSSIFNFDGTLMTKCGSAPEEFTYAELSIPEIRRARKTYTSENAIFNLAHPGYSAIDGGLAEMPYSFYKTWAENPDKAKAISESLTHPLS